MKNLFFFLFLIFNCTIGNAETRIDMQGTSVVGNQELPKILYIIPWKKSESPDEIGHPPIDQLINEVLAPIERDEFKRQIYYHEVFFE
ncbi:MAG: hypothetical protein OEY89_12665 [Gammaproteobacteria bacterium]|nr:hypothetical protein [Gammaproteobacteria bacterium]